MINRKNILLVALLVVHGLAKAELPSLEVVTKKPLVQSPLMLVSAPSALAPAAPVAQKKTEKTDAAALVGQEKKETELKKVVQEKSLQQSQAIDEKKGMFASVFAYCSGAIGGASAAVTSHPVLAGAGGAAIIAGVIWTVYAHKKAQRAKTLEQELDELESAV